MLNKLKTYQLAFIMLAIHPASISIISLFGIELDFRGILEDFIFSSIYLPLLIPESLGITVLKNTPQMFSPPNMVGWLIIFTAWFIVYMLLISLIVKINQILNAKKHNK